MNNTKHTATYTAELLNYILLDISLAEEILDDEHEVRTDDGCFDVSIRQVCGQAVNTAEAKDKRIAELYDVLADMALWFDEGTVNQELAMNRANKLLANKGASESNEVQ